LNDPGLLLACPVLFQQELYRCAKCCHQDLAGIDAGLRNFRANL
jgi:hypothetical protein